MYQRSCVHCSGTYRLILPNLLECMNRESFVALQLADLCCTASSSTNAAKSRFIFVCFESRSKEPTIGTTLHNPEGSILKSSNTTISLFIIAVIVDVTTVFVVAVVVVFRTPSIDYRYLGYEKKIHYPIRYTIHRFILFDHHRNGSRRR